MSRVNFNKMEQDYFRVEGLTLMLLVANLANTKMMQKTWKIIKTLANGYSSKSTQRELSYEYQHDRVSMVFKNLCVLVLWMKVASALEGLKGECKRWLLYPMCTIIMMKGGSTVTQYQLPLCNVMNTTVLAEGSYWLEILLHNHQGRAQS